MNFLKKLGILFLNFETLKAAIVQVYVILLKVKPALTLIDSLVPDDTKIQKGLDKIFPTFVKVVDKLVELIKLVAGFLKIELPVIQASGSEDPIGELEKVLKD